MRKTMLERAGVEWQYWRASNTCFWSLAGFPWTPVTYQVSWLGKGLREIVCTSYLLICSYIL